MMDIKVIRQAIVEALPIETSNYGAAPSQKQMYVPPAHIKALRLECNLVVGGRGVGKSFWTAVLGSPTLPATLGHAVTELERTDVRIGFSVASDIQAYPDGDVFANLLAAGTTPYDVWRAVLARWFRDVLNDPTADKTWRETVDWVRNQPEAFAKLARDANLQFERNGRLGLIVF
ncbi:MAG: hypothetical protein ABT940_14295, partial [Alphaproteobacteria bacterium]